MNHKEEEKNNLQLTVDHLEKMIKSAIWSLRDSVKSDCDEQLITRYQMADLLKVSLPTLRAWERLGQLKPVRLGGRVYYKKSAIASLK